MRGPVGGLENIRPVEVAPVDLMAPDGAEHEVPSSVRIDKGSTERRSIEGGTGPPIHAPICCDERDRPAIADKGVVGDGNVAVVADRALHALTSRDARGEGDTLASARARGRRPTRGPSAMTIANPSTRPMSGAPGLASPVVMSRAVAAAGA